MNFYRRKKMKKIIIVSVIVALTAAGSMAGLIVYDPFNDAEISTVAASNTIPTGWISDEATSFHGLVVSGSLSYPDLVPSQANSFRLGDRINDYYMNFASPNLAVGETIYFSFLFRINSATRANMTAGAIRLFDSADQFGSGIEIGVGVTNLGGNLSFSLDNKNLTWANPLNRTKTPADYTATGVTYLIVGAYTRGSAATDGLTELWINPDRASFGTAAPPAATLATKSFASDANWNRLQIISAGSTSWPANWQIDEVRIGTDWASVVPGIPAPALKKQ
jgi:hypothetical protein